MATKKKPRKKQEKETFIDSELMSVLAALILVMLTIIGALNMGIVGKILSSICRYLFGTYHGVVYGVFFVYSMTVLIKRQNKILSVQQSIGLFSILIALLLWSAIPQNNDLKGFVVLQQYMANTMEHFKANSTVLAQGGLVGAALYSITSSLVDKEGTWVLIAGLLVLALILLIKRSSVDKAVSSVKTIKGSLSFEPKKETKTKQEDIYGGFNVEAEEIKPKGPARFLGKLTADEGKTEEVVKETVKPSKKMKPIQADLEVPQVHDSLEDSKVEEKPEDEEKDKTIPVFKPGASYRLPPFALLDTTAVKNKSNANLTAAQAKGKRLIEILHNFGIPATLVATHIGPAVTKFEIRPDSSVKVNRIMNISDNIKMELAARDIRIEAPIPGRNAVGIEVPNVETTMVKMMELMKNFPPEKKDKKMMFVLGKDLMGRCVYCELDKMPHLLIAGATGSGKSVCMNTIITSFIMRTRPDEVKLLLIDPKKVEFTPYHGIPHLIGPVISDANEASRALKVIVEMMENRFEIFAKTEVRNITGYNEKVAASNDPKLTKMPYVVVIIDELADLMMVAGKEVEMSIQRITQLARAAGIHLIVATQRPSTDVITGLIKSNIPSRISFSVSSGIDSRTILDSVGAERLLGNGDMLYLPIGEPSAIRLQGVYVNDEEVRRIADFVSGQYKPFYDDAFIRLEGVDNNEATAVLSAQDDPMYDEIKEYVIEAQKASTSLLQRRFGIGYNRAARMIDVLEERGVIGPAQGSKPRDVYMKKQEEEA